MSFTTADIRNIVLTGHGGTGKTTLLEQMLYNGGKIPKAEAVSTGRTVSDYTDEEKERAISIHTAMGNMIWKDHQINIMDTPGSSDFVGEVVAAFRAGESAIILVDAKSGVQIETIKLWRRLNMRNMPRAVFVNKMDIDRADFDKSMDDLKTKFQKTVVPVTIPIGSGSDFKGIVNLIENKAYLVHDASKKDEPSEIPAEMSEIVEEYRLTLIESAAEGEDSLMEKYFEEGTLNPDDIRLGLTAGMRDNRIVPVLCGSAELNNGIASLLNFVSIAAPSPACIKEIALNKDSEEIEYELNQDAPVAAMSFKTSIDQFSGKMSYVKVFSGCLKSDIEVFNPSENKKEKIGKLFRSEGKNLTEVKELIAGDIGVLTKLNNLHTNDTICDPANIVEFKALKLPQPVHSLTIHAKAKKDEDKLNQSLTRAAEEDLTFQLRYDTETKESVISGMGELHINMILDRIREKQKIDMETKVPRVAYRETITKSSTAEYTHKKQSGGHGQYGRVVMEIKPLPRGEYLSFVNAIKGGSISKGYMPGIEKGVTEAMGEGCLAGYPLSDLEARIVDGKEHPVDSSEMAFKLASKGALKAALEKAGVVLLEPVMNLKVFAEDQYMGDILSDLSSRRGRVSGQESLGGGIMEIDAEVPQAELLRYSIDLRSITSGTASFEMEFDHYSPISGKIAQDVINSSKQAVEV